MKIFSGENLTLIWEFFEDDGTPVVNLLPYDISIIIRQRFKAAIIASTKDIVDTHKIVDIRDNSVLIEFDNKATSKLGGEYVIEIKLTREKFVTIAKSTPFTVVNSLIGKNLKL